MNIHLDYNATLQQFRRHVEAAKWAHQPLVTLSTKKLQLLLNRSHEHELARELNDKAHTAAHWWAQQGLAVPGDNVWQHSIKTLDQLFLLHYSRLCADKKCFGGESDDH